MSTTQLKQEVSSPQVSQKLDGLLLGLPTVHLNSLQIECPSQLRDTSTSLNGEGKLRSVHDWQLVRKCDFCYVLASTVRWPTENIEGRSLQKLQKK